jgi:hypothetical protein
MLAVMFVGSTCSSGPMNIRYVRRFHMANEYKAPYVRWWCIADEHKPCRPVPTQLQRFHYVHRFPDEYKGHVSVPPNHACSTWPMRIFLKKNFLFCLPPRLGGPQNRYKQTEIQYITIQHISNTSNITCIQYVEHYNYLTPLRHINIQTSQVIECTAHHTAESLCSALHRLC